MVQLKRFPHGVLVLATVLVAACDQGTGPKEPNTLPSVPPQPPHLVFVVQPTSGTAGVAISPPVQVAIKDSVGNTVATATDSITVAVGKSPSGGSLSGTRTVAAVNGVATFPDLSLDKTSDPDTAGYTLTATATGFVAVTSAGFRVGPRPAPVPPHLEFVVQPANAIAGAIIAPAIQVAIKDSIGATIATASDTITIAIGHNPYGGKLGGTPTVAAINGLATFADLEIDKSSDPDPSGYTLTASARGVLNASSDSFRVAPAPGQSSLVFATVTTGGFHSCGVTTSGAAYCWGQADLGQLGFGATPPASCTISPQSGEFMCPTPVPVAGGLTFASISAGNWETCGVTTAGELYCWGMNVPVPIIDTTALARCGSYPFLGIPACVAPVPVGGGITFATVSVGMFHACGVSTDQRAYCWGEDFEGQLGDSTDNGSGGLVSGGLRFVSVSAGGRHTCGVTTSGAAYCWGAYALGTTTGLQGCFDDHSATTGCSFTPVAVDGGLTFKTVSAGSGQSCGVTVSGDAYCWGAAAQLGTGAQNDSPTPVAVAGGLTFTTVVAGQVRTCGITTAGTGYCWGETDQYIAGSALPALIPGGLTFSVIGDGWTYFEHICGVTTGGVAYCWGSNYSGAIGDGTTTDNPSPVKVAGQP